MDGAIIALQRLARQLARTVQNRMVERKLTSLQNRGLQVRVLSPLSCKRPA
jgi:hypothetical protein